MGRGGDSSLSLGGVGEGRRGEGRAQAGRGICERRGDVNNVSPGPGVTPPPHQWSATPLRQGERGRGSAAHAAAG